ncbi:MAG TPA: hypothetical protein VFU22_11140 [Roseiflexaceae bacterium]|nr:hypothetical protein [Roseiflexaceae bacterium]
MTMIMLSRNGSFTLNILDDRAAGRSKATIELPADTAGQPGDLSDKVFAFTFDVLGIQSVELRVRAADEPRRLAGATPAYLERRA